MKVTRKWMIPAATGVLLVSAYAVAGRKSENAKAPTGAVASAVAERRDLTVSVEASGTLEAVRMVEVKSRASGEVRAVRVESGDEVTVGTLIAEVDPRDVRNAFEQAEADLQSAQVKLETTTAQLNRMKELRDSNSATEQEYEAALDQQASARTAVVRAQTNRELAREKMGDVTIRAPINGTVIERTVEQGQIIASATGNVSGGTTLVKLADLSQMRVRALVDETDIGRIQAGVEARVTAEAYPNRVFRGTVEKIEPQAVVDQNVTMFPVLIRLENPQGLLKPGMNAEVVVDVAHRENVVAISSEAVVSMRDAASAARALGVSPEAVAALRSSRSTGAANGSATDAQGQGPSSQKVVRPAATRTSDNATGPAQARGTDAATRPGVVFVESATAVEPRLVQLGLSDWEYTEIVTGLQEGERAKLVTVAQFNAQQAQNAERMQRRAGGMMPGQGGGASRGGR